MLIRSLSFFRSSECKAIGDFASKPESDLYCHENCLGYPSVCPEDRCKCFPAGEESAAE